VKRQILIELKRYF